MCTIDAAPRNECNQLSEAEINNRNPIVRDNVVMHGMRLQEVSGNGNCLFAAISVNLVDSEVIAEELREAVANQLEHHGDAILLEVLGASVRDDTYADVFINEARRLRNQNTWAGEEALMAASHLLQRRIYVYVGNTVLVYPDFSVPRSNEQPLRIAFFAPGHYLAIEPNSISLRNDMAVTDSSIDLTAAVDMDSTGDPDLAPFTDSTDDSDMTANISTDSPDVSDYTDSSSTAPHTDTDMTASSSDNTNDNDNDNMIVACCMLIASMAQVIAVSILNRSQT